MIKVPETAPEDLAETILEHAKEIKAENPNMRWSECCLRAKSEAKRKYGVEVVVQAMSLHGRAKLTPVPE